MDRRAFLVTTAAVLAGCGQGGGNDTDTPASTPESGTPTATATPSPTSTPTSGPANLTVTDVSTPSDIEINTAFAVAVTVENSGGRTGTFAAPVEASYGTGDWETTDATVEIEVPAGETATGEAELGPHPYVEPASFRVPDAEPVARPRFVGRELAYGDTYALPNGIELTVETPTFADTYEYETESGTARADPTETERWIVTTVRAENVGDEPASAPLVSDLAFFRGEDQEFAYQHIEGNLSRYAGGELEPGAVSEGDLPSDVPRDAALSDLRFEHDDEYEGGRVTVNWRSDE